MEHEGCGQFQDLLRVLKGHIKCREGTSLDLGHEDLEVLDIVSNGIEVVRAILALRS